MLALVVVVAGWWWLECLGLYDVGVGALIYFAVVLALHFQEPPGSSRLTQAGFIVMVALTVCVIRVHDIWRYTFEPRRK
ncbi:MULTISPECIES: hypothetical protein [unclassified Microbacterium]|uniref:hypothetical protein n=1 Tax=unclassified Microbacterium TaxID=2609290 RepID=UPI00301AC8F4